MVVIKNESTMKLTTPSTTALLADKNFDIEFNGYLSNHAKHAIIALDKLEAPAERIEGYWKDYTTMTPYNLELHKVDQDWDEVTPCSLEEWKELKGQKKKWQEQVAFMDKELNEKFDGNTDKLIRKYAPPLLSGLAGALTHGIIHLGWAIDAGSTWMICEGLAYLNFCHLGVDEEKLEKDIHAELAPMDSFVRVATSWEGDNLKTEWVDKAKAAYDESFHPELVSAGFQWELSKVMKDAHPIATQLPDWLNEKSVDELWHELYRDVTYLYLATRDAEGKGNFVVLHLLTSLWGLEQVCRLIDNGPTMMKVTRNALNQYYASLICMLATGSIGFPSSEALEKVQTEFASLHVDVDSFEWTPIVENGIAETEEHNIKLVYVMRELWNRYGRWSGFSEAATSLTVTPDIGPGKEFSS
jgi:hypothetical protein